MVEAIRVVRKFSAIVLEISYTRFLLGQLDDAFNYKSGSKSGWVKGSSLYFFFNQLLYVFWKEKNKFIKFKEIIT